MQYNEIERHLQEEIRGQKRTASGIHNKKGLRGYVGKMLFPTDLMSRKEKMAYRKASKVEVTSMFDTILSYEEFLKLSEDNQKKYLTEYRKRFKTKEIMAEMGISNATYYRLADSLGVTKRHKATSDKKKKPKASKAVAKAPTVVAEIIEPEKVSKQYKPDGIVFGYGGQKTAEEIIHKLTKLQMLLEDEKSLFDIEIKVREMSQ